jgi:hypothetical protein
MLYQIQRKLQLIINKLELIHMIIMLFHMQNNDKYYAIL